MPKIRVYVYSIKKIPTVDLVDKEGALHACAQAGNTPFESLRHYPGVIEGGLLSVEERKATEAVESFCRKNGYQFEVVDFADLNFLSKLACMLRLKRKVIRSFPTITCGEKYLRGVPTEKELEKLTISR